MEHLTRIVKAYDVRGVVGEELTPEVAIALGRAAAVELHGEGVVVGRDMRPSSPALAEAFMAGVRAQGVDTIDLGLASTDLVYYASGRLGLPAAMWTASHNPARYNGVKLCRAGAEPVSVETGLAEIRDRAAAGDFPLSRHLGAHRTLDLLEEYAAHVRSFARADVPPLRIAIDAGNGMGGHVVPAVFEALPHTVVPLYFELDGTFPNHLADPLDPANLADLQKAVVEEGCALGLAFDGDADRMACVDERGEIVPASIITALIARTLLHRHPGATILHNLICSRIVPETIARAGGHPVRTRVGHSFIKALMKETDALFAGEHSGHYYFRDNFRADSALIAAVVLLETVALSGQSLSELVAPLAVYVASGELNTAVADPEAALRDVADVFAGSAELDWTDGLTVQEAGWWFNLRPSNTEPLLRLNVEAEDEPTMTAVRDRVLDLVRG